MSGFVFFVYEITFLKKKYHNTYNIRYKRYLRMTLKPLGPGTRSELGLSNVTDESQKFDRTYFKDLLVLQR